MAASYKQPSKRVPQKPKKSTQNILRRVWKNSESKLSLKAWVREQLAAKTDELTVIQAQDWLFNKRADFHSNQLCTGRTRTRVKKGGNVNGPEKNLSGK
jgi:hypothetical protein